LPGWVRGGQGAGELVQGRGDDDVDARIGAGAYSGWPADFPFTLRRRFLHRIVFGEVTGRGWGEVAGVGLTDAVRSERRFLAAVLHMGVAGSRPGFGADSGAAFAAAAFPPAAAAAAAGALGAVGALGVRGAGGEVVAAGVVVDGVGEGVDAALRCGAFVG
jgi:hypothetical protein